MNLDLGAQQLLNGLAVEASAGTGKTYSITGMLTRELVADDQLAINQVLITTFTRNAAAELRDRVRRMLVQAEASLCTPTPPDDPFLKSLRGLVDPAEGAARLRRALAAFDTANIMTIHQFCSIVLRAASQPITVTGDEVPIRRTISRAVNDEMVVMMGRDVNEDPVTGILQRELEPERLVDVVAAALSHPTAVLRLVTGAAGRDAATRRSMELSLGVLIDRCLARVRAALDAEPSYDELIRRARDVVCGGEYESVRQALAARFRWVLVDEAQDTDSLQWEILGALFADDAAGSRRGLISIGDPKQAIYGFRGADVNAYLRHVAGTTADLQRTLTTNYRSDEDLVGALNVLLEGATFGGVADGPVIRFEQVSSRRLGSAVTGIAPMVLIDVPGATGQERLFEPVVAQVLRLLDGRVTVEDGDGAPRPVRPGDITVLSRTGSVAQRVQRELVRRGVPAVSNSTESVAKGATFAAVRHLVRAMERPSDDGRVRMLAASALFGRSMLDPIMRDEPFLEGMQDVLERWRTVLEVDGVTGLAAAVLAAEVPVVAVPVSSAFLGTIDGLRRLTDFAHVVEYLHAATRGRGVQPAELLVCLDELSLLDDKSEVAARRVETDDDAVQSMTIHSAKGLEFPIVIVADLWKSWIPSLDGRGAAVVEWEHGREIPAGTRVIDAGHAVGGEIGGDVEETKEFVAEVDRLRRKATFDERSRLFYVAVTRAKHHLTVVVPGEPEAGGFKPDDVPVAVRRDNRGCVDPSRVGDTDGRAVREVPRSLPRIAARSEGDPAPVLDVAPSTRTASITQPRTSFTSITRSMSRMGSTVLDELPRVDDEQVGEPAGALVDPRRTTDLPLWPLPAGRQFGIALHSILEHVAHGGSPLSERVRDAVRGHASPGFLSRHEDALVDGLTRVLETPLGASWDDARLCDLDPSRRLNELRFNAGLSTEPLQVAALGRHLASRLTSDDPLRPYVAELASTREEIEICGVLNGSVDTMLWLPVRGEDRLVICDYKSNRIAQPDDLEPIDRYSPARLRDEMAHHHYPLQALLYGVAAFRYLRWRTGDASRADWMVGGYAYLFVRGMVGASTPSDRGGRYGVASWSSDSYPGLWRELSDLLGGVRP